jgi:hypothetical protein
VAARLLPIDECATELGVTVSTLRHDIERGLRPAVPARGRGRKALFDPDHVQAWRAARARPVLLDAEDGDLLRTLRVAVESLPAVIAEAVRAVELESGRLAHLHRPVLARVQRTVAVYARDHFARLLPGLAEVDDDD